jgi:hypothetical protein
MTENPYDHMLKPGPFEKAVDKAIAEENERVVREWSPEEGARLNEMVERYVHLEAAQEAAGGYGVVLPLELARAILAGLRSEETLLSLLSSDLPERMLQDAIDKAEAR